MNSLSLSLLLEEINRVQPIYNSVLLSLQDGIALYGYGLLENGRSISYDLWVRIFNSSLIMTRTNKAH